MKQSLGIFVSYSFRHMFNKIEMPIFAIRRLYVQFSMTICAIFPTVYNTQRSNFSYSHLYLLHSMLTDWYMLLFNYTITSCICILYLHLNSITILLKENSIKMDREQKNKIESVLILYVYIVYTRLNLHTSSNRIVATSSSPCRLSFSSSSSCCSSFITYSINTSLYVRKLCLVSSFIHEKVIDSCCYLSFEMHRHAML